MLPSFLRVFNDEGLVVSILFWFLFIIVLLLFSIAMLKAIQLVGVCCSLTNKVIVLPVRGVYHLYQDYNRIEPLPIFEV
uniref:Envelope protein n=1 Tax=Mouse coronavirus TaxID=2913384 RepID=A0AA49X784_9NIDO|nr:envelope protein [Mouse coronavirus]